MNLKKRIISLFSAAIAAFVPVRLSAFAYEEPTDIHVTVETKEIYLEDIPADRQIPLEIYTENCPPYTVLSLFFEKDSRLSYASKRLFEEADAVSNECSLNSLLGSGDYPDFRGCSIISRMGSVIDYNGCVLRMNVILPENVSEGDFFKVDLLRNFYDRIEERPSIALDDYMAYVYYDSPFTQLNNGGIRIKSHEPPPPPPPPSGGGQDPNGGGSSSGGDSGNSGNNGSLGGGGSQNPNNSAPTDNNSTAAVTTVIKETTNTTAKTTVSSKKTTTTTEKTTISHSSETSENTTRTSTTVSEGEPPENNKNGLLIIILVTASVIAMSGAALVYNKLRIKK